MAAFATVEDITLLGGKKLTADETERAGALLPVVSNMLRSEASRRGYDLDAMAGASEAYADTARMVTVDVTIRAMRQTTDGVPVSQESQTALGYTWQGTYSIPGGGVAGCIMNNDLKRLGLKRQRYGAVDIYGIADGNNNTD